MRYWLSKCSGGSGSPEVAVHLLWSGGILINGARCGKLRVSANHQDPTKVPDWLCVGLELDLWPASRIWGKLQTKQHYTLRDAQRLTLLLTRSLGAPYFELVDQMGSRWGKNVHNEWRGLAHGIGEKQTYMKDSKQSLWEWMIILVCC